MRAPDLGFFLVPYATSAATPAPIAITSAAVLNETPLEEDGSARILAYEARGVPGAYGWRATPPSSSARREHAWRRDCIELRSCPRSRDASASSPLGTTALSLGLVRDRRSQREIRGCGRSCPHRHPRSWRRGLHAELARDGICVTTVSPGVLMNAMCSETMARMMSMANRVLPSPTDARVNEARPGWQSVSRSVPAAVTTLSDRASADNNELPADPGGALPARG